MIGLGWIMMYNSMIEKCIEDNNIMNNINVNKKSELKKNNINLDNIIVVDKIRYKN
jgi:hypothetical protein